MNSHSEHAGYRALRKGRVSLCGQRYLVTTICYARRLRFADPNIAAAVASKLRDAELWRDAQPLCWVLMPDHLHIILELGAQTTLSRTVQRVKAVCAKTANASLERNGSFWMPGFHDRALRREENMKAVADYVLANPTRAGIAGSIGEYPHAYTAWPQE
jgi:putative transposase